MAPSLHHIWSWLHRCRSYLSALHHCCVTLVMAEATPSPRRQTQFACTSAGSYVAPSSPAPPAVRRGQIEAKHLETLRPDSRQQFRDWKLQCWGFLRKCRHEGLPSCYGRLPENRGSAAEDCQALSSVLSKAASTLIYTLRAVLSTERRARVKALPLISRQSPRPVSSVSFFGALRAPGPLCGPTTGTEFSLGAA